MNVLVIGGAGYVGSIIRAALEREHHCVHFDLKPVPESGDRSIIGDVGNDAAMKTALARLPFDAVLYLAMGAGPGDSRFTNNQIDPAFAVNVTGTYRVIQHAVSAGVKRFVYASTLSVYNGRIEDWPHVDESRPTDAWAPYGFSKRLAEYVLAAAAQRYPDRTFLGLRLILPRNETDWPKFKPNGERANLLALGPEDSRRLFLASLALDRPGVHIVQATGDVAGTRMPNTRAADLLGWQPHGE